MLAAQNDAIVESATRETLLEPFVASANNFGIHSPAIMNNPLLQSTMAAAVHQHQQRLISGTSTNDFGAFANQLATAAAVVAGTVAGTNSIANPAMIAGRSNGKARGGWNCCKHRKQNLPPCEKYNRSMRNHFFSGINRWNWN